MTRYLSTRHVERSSVGGNILVVDDSVSIRHFLSTSLETAGYATAEAEDGEDAYQMARDKHFDLVITDQNMPRMNGVVLIQELRALPSYATVPILVLSIESNPELKRKARECGASGWVVKPVASNLIIDIARRLLAPRAHGSVTAINTDSQEQRDQKPSP